MQLKFFILVCLSVALITRSYAQVVSHSEAPRHRLSVMDTLQNRGENRMYSDSLSRDIDEEKANLFYDSLESKSGRWEFTKFLYRMLVRKPQRDTTLTGRITDEVREMERYAGRTIGDVEIVTGDVFEHAKSVVQKASNAIHVTTYESVIRRDLFFKPGDLLDPLELVLNSQLLRSRQYLSNIWIDLVPRLGDSTMVDIKIRTRDKWSISADLDFGSEQRARMELYDENLLGSGNRLAMQTNYAWTESKYGGNQVSYNIPNVMGTFFTADLVAGRDFEDTRMDVELKKVFYKPDDYEIGVAYNDDKVRYWELSTEDYTKLKYRIYDGWGGVSRRLGAWQSSGYLMGRYSHGTFDGRPEVTPTFNTRFHNFETALVSVGVYREKFYSTNLIYGFGYKEYLAAGYRAEMTFGYNWGEFRNDYYAGLNLQKGGYTKIGYFMAAAVVGTYLSPEGGERWMSTVNANIRWFSNLFVSGRSRIRQFVTLSYTRGWNRGEGEGEYLTFTRESGPRSIKDNVFGRSRGVISTETVLFTPYHPLGFNVALFGYLDAGVIGNHPNIFRNSFYSTFGVGVRLRNERLIFNTIQFRLGLAVGRGGMINNRRFQTSSEQRVGQYRFIPTRPEVIQLNSEAGRKRR